MLSALFTVIFGFSLLPGRKPVCLAIAERTLHGVLPDGAVPYCRRLTWVWLAILAGVTATDVVAFLVVPEAPGLRYGLVSASVHAAVYAVAFAVELAIRHRTFAVAFHTSGSTGRSKTIVKGFATLARETACHRDHYRRRLAADGTRGLVFLATIDPAHMYGTLWRRLLPRALGVPCDPEVILTPESLLAKMKAAERVFLVTTPSFLDRFTAYAGQYDVPRNCVEIVTSGALLTKDVSDRTAAVFGVTPRQIFGSTETGGVASRRGDGDWQVLEAVAVRAAPPVEEGARPRLAVRSPYSFQRGWYVLGDGVEIAPDGRSFRLFGRTDRLVKINEERVNLAEMEAKVRALGYPDCALARLEGPHGPFLGCVLVRPAPDVRRSSLDLRRHLLPVFPKGTVPKRFRLVHELPRNAQGKVVNAAVVRLLESALVEPNLRVTRRTDDVFEAQVTFDPAAPYFQGHFPGAPILPGVAQLGFAERCAEALRGRAGALRQVKKMKFVHIIEPDVEVTLRIVRRTPDEYTYEYLRGEQTCATGVLVF